MKLSFEKIFNKNTEKSEAAPDDVAIGFAYLNDMANELDKMEKLDTDTQPSLEAILDAEINELEVDSVDTLTDYQVPDGLSPKRLPDVDYDEFMQAKKYLVDQLRAKSKHSYIQSMRVSVLAAECAQSINANHQLSKAIGLYSQLDALNTDGTEFEAFLMENAFPGNLIEAISEVRREEKAVSTREAAIVYLTAKITTAFFFLKAQKNKNVEPDKIVDKAIGTEITKGSLNNSGLSLKECNEIRNFFVNKLKELL